MIAKLYRSMTENDGPFLALLITFIFFTLYPSTPAQSGRKLPNQKSQPPSSPPSKTEETEKKSDVNSEDKKVKIVISYYTLNFNIPQYYSNLIARACADRLQETGDVKVQFGGEMDRKKASDFAKNNPSVFIALLQLEIDSMRSSNSDWNSGYIDPRYLFVNYTVFEPLTGKNRSSGRTYPRSSATDPMSLPPTRQAADQRLKVAAEEAADRIATVIGVMSKSK